MNKPVTKPLPRINETTRAFWEGCRQHELRIQKCSKCDTFRFPPQHMCRACSSDQSEWTTVSGTGAIYSYIIPTNQSPGELPARGFEYPFAVVLVELDGTGGVRIASNVIDCELSDIAIGLRVEPHFEDINDEISLPKFRLADRAGDQS
ncbi:Zn-ribbon domain-containing OB-fold protein [Hyphomonas sp.]|uniref:Zn-ribbon domain-containing OB-fold protein n=1 Tax=Hyphomonas sp. TaxID=87 RepID=UPI003D29F498